VYGDKKIIIILREHRAIEKFLGYESVFMLYPYVTVPDADGRYFISAIGVDYMYFPILSIASEEKSMFMIYEPVSNEHGVRLVPRDIRTYIESLIPLLRKVSPKNVKLIDILDKLIKKPYLVLRKIDELKSLIGMMDKRTMYVQDSPIYRTMGRPLANVDSLALANNRQLLDMLKGFIRTIEIIKSMDDHIMDVSMYRMMVCLAKDANMMISGRIHEQKIRKLQKFGAGHALYLSGDEVREFLGGKNFVRVTFIVDRSGRRKILIEPI